MEKSFIEVYDNVLSDDLCNQLISLFERGRRLGQEKVRKMDIYYSSDMPVKPVRTALDPKTGETHYVKALEMGLYSQNYNYEHIMRELDEILKYKIYDYNKKYHVWTSELNMNLIPTEEERQEALEDDNDVEILNYYIYRHGDYVIKKYKNPDDGFHVWHTDWATFPLLIQRTLAVQFFLNDVDEGGETEFYHQRIKVKPKKGRLVVWPVGFTHTHRGNNPISNEKYIISSWMTMRNLAK